MPTTTYIIRFAHRYRPTSVPYEEQEHTNLADAWEAYRLLTEPTRRRCTPKSSWSSTTTPKTPSA